LFQNTSPVRQKLSGKKPLSIPPLEGTKIRSPDRRRSYHAFYRLIQLTGKEHTRAHTQPRKDFSHQKTEPNHNKKRQQTNNQTKQSKNGIPETSTDKKSTHKNTLTPAKRDVQIAKLELSSPPPPPPPPPRNPTTPQAKRENK